MTKNTKLSGTCRKTVQYRKWSPTANDPETANDPQNGPQMILDHKWSLKSTANNPVKTSGMEWILWDSLQKRTDYKKETFFSCLLKKKGRRTLHLRSIYTRRKKMEQIWKGIVLTVYFFQAIASPKIYFFQSLGALIKDFWMINSCLANPPSAYYPASRVSFDLPRNRRRLCSQGKCLHTVICY